MAENCPPKIFIASILIVLSNSISPYNPSFFLSNRQDGAIVKAKRMTSIYLLLIERESTACKCLFPKPTSLKVEVNLIYLAISNFKNNSGLPLLPIRCILSIFSLNFNATYPDLFISFSVNLLVI